MEVPSRFIIYAFLYGVILSVVITIGFFYFCTPHYDVETANGINVSVEEFIEEVQLIEDISNNFSVPSVIFNDIVDVDIRLASGKSNREFYVNNRVEGISMLPGIYAGSTLICIKDFTKGELQINSIIVFNRNNGYVSHRIVDIQNGSYITKGDNNMVTDAPVEYEDVHCLIGGIIF